MFKEFVQDIVMITNEAYRNLSVKNYLALGDTILVFVYDRWFVAESEVGRDLLKLSTKIVYYCLPFGFSDHV